MMLFEEMSGVSGPEIRRNRQRIWTLAHKIKWFFFWVFCCKSFLLWMAYNDAEPSLPKILDAQLNYSYANLNKFGNDASGCPDSPDKSIRVSCVN